MLIQLVKLRQLIERNINSDIKKKMAGGIFWSFTGNLLSKALMLLASIILARILGQTAYGEVGFIRSTLNMFVALGGLGLGMTATKYAAGIKHEKKQEVSEVLGFSFLLTFVAAAVIMLSIYVFSSEISVQTMNAPHLSEEIRISALIVFFLVLNGYLAGIMQGFQAFREMAYVNLASGIISFVLQIVLAYFWGIKGAIIGFGAGYAAITVLFYYYSKRYLREKSIKYSYRNLKTGTSVFFRFSLPAALSGLLVTPVYWLCNVILVRQVDGYNEMAIFDAGNTWRLAVLFIPMAISQIVLPLLIEEQKNAATYKKIVRYNIYINVFISLFISLLIAVFGKWIMLGYGASFERGYLTLIVLCFSNVLVAVNNVIGQVLASRDKMWVGFGVNLLWGIEIVLLALWLVPKYGALGLSVSILLSYVLHTFCQIIVIKKLYETLS